MDTMKELSAANAALIFLAFFVVLLFFALCKKIWSLMVFKKKYYIIPRPSIKGISNISMVIALSVAVLILITVITQNIMGIIFRAFPGSRITIEGMLIKIGGLLFGPFIGMLIGLLTDMLSIALTAGIFHYGYFISAMAYGLLSGLVRSFIINTSSKRITTAISSTIFLLVVYGIAMAFMYTTIPTDETVLKIQFLPMLELNREIIVGIVSSFIFIALALIWIFYGFSIKRRNKKLAKFNLLAKDKETVIKHYDRRSSIDNAKLFTTFCPSIVCVLATELLINVLIMPSFDADLSTLTYVDWFIIRLAIFIPMIFVNMFIIMPVFAIVSPLVTWDYRKELYDDLKAPLYIN